MFKYLLRSLYHCFLAIISKYGYESKNQSCTITALLHLIENEKLDFDKDLVFQFDTLEVEKDLASPTVRMEREISTYGVDTSINLQHLKHIKKMIVEVQRETIRLL